VEISKPDFKRGNNSTNEPHFREINQNEDLYMKNLTTHKVEISNVYSEPKDETSKNTRTEKKYFNKPYKNDENTEYNSYKTPSYKPHEKEKEVDSDGFEEFIKKGQTYHPKKYPNKTYEDRGDRGEFKNFKKGERENNKFDKFTKKDDEKDDEKKNKGEDKREQPVEKIKAVHVVPGELKKLGDLFSK